LHDGITSYSEIQDKIKK